MITEFKTDIQSLISVTEHVDKRKAEFAKLHNSLIEANASLEEEVTCLSDKVRDLENCSRHNNIRIWDIPETVSPDLLCPYLIDLTAIILMTCSPINLTMDCIHKMQKDALQSWNLWSPPPTHLYTRDLPSLKTQLWYKKTNKDLVHSCGLNVSFWRNLSTSFRCLLWNFLHWNAVVSFILM